MLYSHKAYFNASGKISCYNLTHDVKRCLADAKAPSGLVTILSTQATTAVVLIENDEDIKQGLLDFAQKQFDATKPSAIARRSGSGATPFHLMAGLTGLSLTLPFAQGKLLTNLQHEIFALDYEPKAGRREFVITVIAAPAPAPAQPPK